MRTKDATNDNKPLAEGDSHRNLGMMMGDCAKFKWELQPIDGFEGNIRIEESFGASDDPMVQISVADHDTDYETIDKIHSCDDERCLDKENADSMKLYFCITNDVGSSLVKDSMDKIKIEMGGDKFEWKSYDPIPGLSLDNDCCTATWDSTLDEISIDCSYGRKLGEIEVPSSPEGVRNLIQKNGADPKGIFALKDSLMSMDACNAAMAFLEESYMRKGYDEEAMEKEAEADGRNLPPSAHYVVDMTGSEFVDLIGKEQIETLLDFYNDSFGHQVPITTIRLQRSNNKDRGHHFTFHVDHQDNLAVLLGGKNLVGGGIAYLNEDGLHDTGLVVPGTAIVHKADVLHGAMEWTGIRYVLILYSKSGTTMDDCLLKPLLA